VPGRTSDEDEMDTPKKPFGGKAYGHIAHLPGSRLGPGDHRVNDGQARICCSQSRDRHDDVIVQEKLDGSCCAVGNLAGQIVALGRAGYPAETSPYPQHQLFATWVRQREWRFLQLLDDGERAIGEWLAQAHGTRYALPHEPFVLFDIIQPGVDTQHGGRVNRVPFDTLEQRAALAWFVTPHLVHRGGPIGIDAALEKLDPRWHGAIDPIEGAVWRVQRRSEVDFLAKYVRPDKQDGCYLPEVTKGEAIWNWRMDRAA
jgi:hypothetical protein